MYSIRVAAIVTLEPLSCRRLIMCSILNRQFSLLVLVGIALVILFIPPAIAILRSSFYQDRGTIYDGAHIGRLGITLLMLGFLGLADTPWQIYRATQYYQNGVVILATVIKQRTQNSSPIPHYKYQPTFLLSTAPIIAEASLVSREGLNWRSFSFNWLHEEGSSVPVRVLVSCPNIVWTQVQDVSLFAGLTPILVIIGVWIAPKKFFSPKDQPFANDEIPWERKDKDHWRRP